MSTKTLAVVPSVNIFNPEDLLPIGEVARRLHVNVAWVREKVRRPIPETLKRIVALLSKAVA